MSILRAIVATAWLTGGMYLGLAGYVGTKLFETTSIVKTSEASTYFLYDGITFATRQDLQDFLLDEKASRWTPWLTEVPAELMPLLVCVAWGAFGVAVRLLHFQLSRDRSGVNGHVIISPIFGAAMAIVVYYIAFLFPTILAVGPHTMRAEVIVALSILSGIGSPQVYRWLEVQIAKRIGN